MATGDTYRIREGIFERCNGYFCWRDRGYLAERKVRILGFSLWWWPVGDWRLSKGECHDDIFNDQRLRAPISKPELVDPHKVRSGRSK